MDATTIARHDAILFMYLRFAEEDDTSETEKPDRRKFAAVIGDMTPIGTPPSVFVVMTSNWSMPKSILIKYLVRADKLRSTAKIAATLAIHREMRFMGQRTRVNNVMPNTTNATAVFGAIGM